MKETINKKMIFFVITLIILFIVFTQKTNFKLKETIDISEEFDEYAQLRKQMVNTQLRSRDITDERVLDVMEKVPRHKFMPYYAEQAYEDHPVPIGYGQTISQPYIVALMTQLLDTKDSDKVLEIGTGSGYQAAVLAELVYEVYTIEIIEELANRAEQTLINLGYDNAEVKHADGYFGWEENAPFDAIIITAAANHIPPQLIKQLKDNGRLVIPLASPAGFQTLTLVTKKGDDLETRFITGVRFVPMTGETQER